MSRFLTGPPALAFLLTLAGCGGGGDSPQPTGPAAISTLAYVVSNCSGSGAGGTIRQSLQILRQGDQLPITVAEADVTSPMSPAGVFKCAMFSGEQREPDFGNYGVFHRLGVSPDGSQVVFEATDDDPSTLFAPNTLQPQQKGIFAVRADGKDLRPLAPASREPVAPPGTAPAITFAFSPDGRMIAYTDRDEQDVVQIFTADLDLVDGGRNQVTHLPPATPPAGSPARTCCPIFADAQTISFLTIADPNGNNPNHLAVNGTVKTDGTGQMVTQPPVAIPGSQVVTAFRITGELSPFLLRLPTPPPVNLNQAGGGLGEIQEVFVTDGVDVLQLTPFQRQDTWSPTLSADGQHVFFSASAPSGDNPYQECQVFSINLSGGDLRQLTHFHEGPYPRGYSPTGCHSGPVHTGCSVFYLGRDTPSDTLLFYSSCDPFGNNPNGNQLFAMHPDGTGLRQLTNTQGYQQDRASHTWSFEVPFPWAHPGQQDNN